MDYRSFLKHLHETRSPKRYFEIGVRTGQSMCFAKHAAIGVDPVVDIQEPMQARVCLFAMTSDQFFNDYDARALFNGKGADMSLIDGMHLAEFAYRDFVNTARISAKGSLVILDDVLPTDIDIAGRDCTDSSAWTGDVYRALTAIKVNFPTLKMVVVNISGKGLAFIKSPNLTDEELDADSNRETAEALENTDVYRVNSVEELCAQYRRVGCPILSPKEAVTWLKGRTFVIS
ncbi:MAG: class I SAM-dependent methyltransferase [Alphaproteobacteria bacterium]|nr:class I SAM-dependent methyltransferase [Alphaproteobacteria bacterium SS10]